MVRCFDETFLSCVVLEMHKNCSSSTFATTEFLSCWMNLIFHSSAIFRENEGNRTVEKGNKVL